METAGWAPGTDRAVDPRSAPVRTSMHSSVSRMLIATLSGALLGCSGAQTSDPAVDGGPPAGDAGIPEADAGTATGGDSSRVDIVTFNWPSRFGPSAGVDVEDEALWDDLSTQVSVMGLQEAGWIAAWIRRQGWEVYRPDPPDDSDDQPVGNLLAWNPDEWTALDTGWHALSPRTQIQEEAAGPTYHRPKYVVWARLTSRTDGTTWVFGSIHFVPSKHLGGAALELWKLQRDNLLDWWGRQDVRTVVVGDFNAQPADAAAQPFWQVAEHQATESHGTRTIDWIVRTKALSAEGVEALDARGQSDHRPVRGSVRWDE